MDYILENWYKIGVALWLIQEGIHMISRLTPWEWDDRLSDMLCNILKPLFPRKKTTA